MIIFKLLNYINLFIYLHIFEINIFIKIKVLINKI